MKSHDTFCMGKALPVCLCPVYPCYIWMIFFCQARKRQPAKRRTAPNRTAQGLAPELSMNPVTSSPGGA